MKHLRKLMCLAAVCTAVMLGTTETKAEENPTILKGLSIGEVDVSGMTAEEAGEAVNQYLAERLDDEITFHMNGNTYTSKVESLGYSWANKGIVEDALNYGKDGNIIKKYKQKCDLEQAPVSLALETKIDEGAVGTILEQNCSQYNQTVEEYGIRIEDGVPVIIGGRAGVTLDVEKSKVTVADFLTKEWTGGAGDVDLDVVIEMPQTKREDLEKITDVLGAGSTTYGSSSSNRKKNIENGTAKVHGTILYPGESFSMLDACVPFTAENGYKPAGSYESGTVVDTYGGGICQVSTTLYLAVMRSELQIDRRYNHSMLVSYVKPSMDAAIAEGLKDFKFTNNTDAPIYIEGTTDGWEVAFTIYGQDTRPDNREVRFVSETLPNSDPSVELRARLWKIVTVDGEETKTEFNHSTYYKKKEEVVEEAEEDSSEESDDSDNEYEESDDTGDTEEYVDENESYEESEETEDTGTSESMENSGDEERSEEADASENTDNLEESES